MKCSCRVRSQLRTTPEELASCASEDEPGFEALKPNGFAPSSPSYGSGSSASIGSNASATA